MDKPTLNFNPFPEKETIKLIDDERRLLFVKAQTGEEEALNTLVAEYVSHS